MHVWIANPVRQRDCNIYRGQLFQNLWDRGNEFDYVDDEKFFLHTVEEVREHPELLDEVYVFFDAYGAYYDGNARSWNTGRDVWKLMALSETGYKPDDLVAVIDVHL